MQITKNAISELNSVIKVSVKESDYREKVDQNLKLYRKKATIPGFRKGMVPINMIKKQYEMAFVVDEVSNLVQKSIDDFIKEEKLELMGQPIPKNPETINWEAKDIDFEFEMGLEPKFEFDFDALDVKKYKIVLSDEDLAKEIGSIQDRFAEPIEVEAVEEKSWIKAKVSHPAIDQEGVEIYFSGSDLNKNLYKLNKFEAYSALAKDVFENENALNDALKEETTKVWESEELLKLEILAITNYPPAEINQDLIDKVYGEGNVEGEQGLKDKIRTERETQLEAQADQYFLNKTLEALLEKTKFELPDDFLIKWIEFSNKEIKDLSEAEEQYKSGLKDNIRYEVVQSRLAKDYNIQVEEQDLKDAAKVAISPYLSSFPQGEEFNTMFENMYKRIMSNEQERERMFQMAFNKKMIDFFNEKSVKSTLEVTFNQFKEIVEAEQKNKEAKS